MSTKNSLGWTSAPETVAATAGHFLDLHSGGVTPVINTSTTFARDNQYRPLNAAHLYSRDDNPGFVIAEGILAELEQGSECRLFASGMAAVAAVFQTLEPGNVVVLPHSMYWGVTQWTRNFCQQFDVTALYYDPADAESIGSCLTGYDRAEIVWVETPSNPMMQVTDIQRAAEIAHAHQAQLIVDNTTATPVFTRPLTLGADMVMHSATKSLNGHSDVLAGAVVAAEDSPRWQRLCRDRHDAGAVPGAFESWLLVRGLRTLFVRVERAAENALTIARFLSEQPQVESVLYPGLDSHPAHALSKRQMTGGFGSLLSFQVRGDRSHALAVTGALETIISATSLGGVETLIEHRHSVEPPETGVPENLLRLAVGIEHVDDLLNDLKQALNAVHL